MSANTGNTNITLILLLAQVDVIAHLEVWNEVDPHVACLILPCATIFFQQCSLIGFMDEDTRNVPECTS